MWEIKIYRKHLDDTCKPAIQALKSLFKEGLVKVNSAGTLEGVQVLVENISEVVNAVNSVGYETDEDYAVKRLHGLVADE